MLPSCVTLGMMTRWHWHAMKLDATEWLTTTFTVILEQFDTISRVLKDYQHLIIYILYRKGLNWRSIKVRSSKSRNIFCGLSCFQGYPITQSVFTLSNFWALEVNGRYFFFLVLMAAPAGQNYAMNQGQYPPNYPPNYPPQQPGYYQQPPPPGQYPPPQPYYQVHLLRFDNFTLLFW